MSITLTRIKFLLTGIFLGIFLSGSFLLLYREIQIRTAQDFPLKSQAIRNQIPPPAITDQIESKIDINNADKETLMTLPGIGESKAASILNFRYKYGDLETIEELTYVQGIGSGLFSNIQNLIYVSND